jgi:lysophospholipase L1-like esterase
VLCVALVACESAGQPDTHGAKTQAHIAASDPQIRYFGRVDRTDPAAVRFAWPATGFTLRFTGSSIALELDDQPLPDGTEENDWLEVHVDGEPVAPLRLTSGRRRYRVARGLSRGTHDLEVRKRTEAEVGTVGLVGIKLDEGQTLDAPPARPQRILEIVGDSISTGFGLHGANAECQFSAATEDATRTYGALAALDLAAEPWIVAWAGKGVLRNEDPLERETLPAIYDRTLPGDPTSSYAYARHPDAVVINLGTNDFARSAPPEDEFRTAYRAFVAHIRAAHPRAFLVLAVGPMLFDEGAINYRSLARAAIEATIAAHRARGDTRVALLDLWNDPVDGVGCQFHPNQTTHRRMADELARLLRSDFDW